MLDLGHRKFSRNFPNVSTSPGVCLVLPNFSGGDLGEALQVFLQALGGETLQGDAQVVGPDACGFAMGEARFCVQGL